MDKEHSPQWTLDVHRLVKWRCAIEHGEQWFDNKAAFDQHLEEQHHSVCPEGPKLEALKDSCEVSLERDPHACPICNAIPEKLANVLKLDDQNQPTVEADEEDLRSELLRHIAEHLKLIGFLSVEYLKDDDEIASRPSMGETEKSLPQGQWVDGEWVPPVPPYLDKEYQNYSNVEEPETNSTVVWTYKWEKDDRRLESVDDA